MKKTFLLPVLPATAVMPAGAGFFAGLLYAPAFFRSSGYGIIRR